MPNLGSLSHSHGLAEVPLVHQPGPEHLGEVSQPHQGVQGQVGVPKVPLLGHGSEIETPNWACREFGPRKENCKVSKPHQGGQVPPAIAACYHYLLPLRAWVLSRSRHIYLISTVRNYRQAKNTL